MALIDARDVSHLYVGSDGQPTWALQNVSLSIEEGRFTCLVGPSGCGKTTLLQLIAGFMSPTRGAVTLSGAPIKRPGPDRSVVFQEYALFAWFTVRQNVEFGLRVAGMKASERRARSDELLEMVGMTRAAERYPHELSGGMRQRVAVARALATHPDVVLMDEPFAAVDALTRVNLQEELLRLAKRLNLSIVFVTHNIDEAVFLADEVVVMSAHPGSVKTVLTIDMPHPRDRGSGAFANWYTRINGLLHEDSSLTASATTP
ncbi:ABC transporter ATP-binding protein [Acuticoccus kandeliae]|uniref:ABC transporter ATP-binding protein n=1 Tax=Acuticoccus kandeliae TaxID=2073160 RepID=UPI000D3EAB2B|nr:ABC transporter ATP-binding protein [Acuticoccus kandeliae]